MDSRQFVAGSVAGCVGQCVGHPLDSIKVVMQTATSGVEKVPNQQRALSAYQSAMEMYRSPYGLRSFFRGLSLPLMTKSVEQCVAFGIKGAVGDLLLPHKADGEEGSGLLVLADDSYRAGISGAVAGACTAMLLTPVYLVKVQLQATTTIATISPSSPTTALKGPIEAIGATVSRLGWRGLYTGALPTLLGSSIGYGFRFATYDKTVTWVRRKYEESTPDGSSGNSNYEANFRTAKILSIVLGGGLAGMATWLSHFPLDLVANKMMAGVVLSSHTNSEASIGGATATSSKKNCHQNTKKGMLAQFRSIYLQQGWRGYFRGIGPCLLRAFPVNAAIFLSYEVCMDDL